MKRSFSSTAALPPPKEEKQKDHKYPLPQPEVPETIKASLTILQDRTLLIWRHSGINRFDLDYFQDPEQAEEYADLLDTWLLLNGIAAENLGTADTVVRLEINAEGIREMQFCSNKELAEFVLKHIGPDQAPQPDEKSRDHKFKSSSSSSSSSSSIPPSSSTGEIKKEEKKRRVSSSAENSQGFFPSQTSADNKSKTKEKEEKKLKSDDKEEVPGVSLDLG